jgi:hypothetical protein
MEYVNLTPHMVNIINSEITLNIPASGTIARLLESVTSTVIVDGVLTSIVALGEIQGLPESKDGIQYIVSMPLVMGAKAAGISRTDLVYPYGQGEWLLR